MTAFVCLVYQASRRWPDAIAIQSGNTQITYAELNIRVSSAAQGLAQHPKAVTLMRPVTGSLDDIVQLLAAQRLGICVLPINPKLPDAWISQTTQGLRISPWPAVSEMGDTPTTCDYSVTPPALHEQHPLYWILTSGSTGNPKVAVLSSGNLRYSATGALWVNASLPGDRYWMSLPLYHVGGIAMLIRCLLSGATLVLADQVLDAERLRAESITHLSLVPTQLQRLLAQSSDALSHCRQILLGGAPAPAHLLEQAAHLPIQQTYGLTEMASQVVTRSLKGEDVILPYRSVRILDNGELCVSGATLFLGYQTPNGLVPTRDEGDWFHTRDLGYWDNKQLRILGRLDNQFISGGENIQPETLERLLLQHPDVTQAFVVPVSNHEFGHRPVAFVDSDTPADELAAWLAPQVPSYLKPIAIYRLDVNDGLKTSRHALQQLAEQRIHVTVA